jgi:hypothetical protein
VGAGVGDPRDGAQLPDDAPGDPVHLRLGHARRALPLDQQVAVLEPRQQRAAADRRQHREPGQGDDADRQKAQGRPADQPPERRAVAALQPAGEAGLAAAGRSAGEQQQRQPGREHQRHQHRDEHRQQVGADQRPDERAGQALHEQERRCGERDDQRRVQQRAAHLQGRAHDGGELRLPVRLLGPVRPVHPALRSRDGRPPPQAASDAVDVDDRIVDHDRQRDHKARQQHRVEGRTAQVEHVRRRHQRQRDGHQDHHGGAPVAQDRAKQGDHDDQADQQRHPEVVGRRVDEARRPEQAAVDGDARQPGPHVVERGLHTVRDLAGVGPWELLDDQHEAGPVVADRVADQRLMVLHHRGHVAQPQGSGAGALHGHRGQVLGRGDGGDVLDPEPLVGGVDEAAGAWRRGFGEAERRHPQRVRGALDDLVERDPLASQPPRIDLDLELPLALTPDGHVRHARHAHEARPDLPARQHRHVDQRHVPGGEPDHQDPAGRRQRLEHAGRLGHVRDPAGGLDQALLHQLPGLQHVGPRLEDQLDPRQPGERLGAELVEERDPVEQVLLERDGDQLLHLFRREPERLGLDVDQWRVELRKHVHRRVAELGDAKQHQPGGDRQHQKAQPQARRNDPAHHRGTPAFAAFGSAYRIGSKLEMLDGGGRSGRCARPGARVA